MSYVTMQCLASLATGKALRIIDELCESQSRVGTWKLSTLVATARSELGECAFQLRKSHDALETECSRVTGENARLYDQIVELHLQCDQLRAERDSHQRLCIAEMEKNSQLRADLEAIRGQGVLYVSAESLADEGVVGMHATRKPNAVQSVALYSLPPQQPHAVSVPRELLERLQLVCQRPHESRDAADELDVELRALLSTKNAEEDQPCDK